MGFVGFTATRERCLRWAGLSKCSGVGGCQNTGGRQVFVRSAGGEISQWKRNSCDAAQFGAKNIQEVPESSCQHVACVACVACTLLRGQLARSLRLVSSLVLGASLRSIGLWSHDPHTALRTSIAANTLETIKTAISLAHERARNGRNS